MMLSVPLARTGLMLLGLGAICSACDAGDNCELPLQDAVRGEVLMQTRVKNNKSEGALVGVKFRKMRFAPWRSGRLHEIGKDDALEVIVQYSDNECKQKVDALNQGSALQVRSNVEKVTVTSERIRSLEDDPCVEAVEEDFVQTIAVLTPQPEEVFLTLGEEDTPWGITDVQASLVPQGENRVKVCVVDTGYGMGHPDLPTKDHDGVDGYSPYGENEKWDTDGHGHGSHCAGTIGAVGNNSVGVTSVNPNSTKFSFFIGKGLTNGGSGSHSSVMAAVNACEEAGAKIISMSLGGGPYSAIAANEYKEIWGKGVLIIAAAGNAGNAGYSYPASYDHVMSVAAIDSSGNKAGFSQFNDQVEIAAPGVAVKSTITEGNGAGFSYASWSGTSMATTHVAGVAALVWSNFGECTNYEIRTALIQSAKDLGAPGCDDQYGYGSVKAKQAYDYLVNHPCVGNTAGWTEGGCPHLEPHECNQTELVVNVTTDNYPAETAWKVMNATNHVLAVGGGFTDKSTLYSQKVCLADGIDFKFQITDTYGDGVCCEKGQGFYNLAINGQVVKSGGSFGDGENFTTPAPTHVIQRNEFCQRCTCCPTV